MLFNVKGLNYVRSSYRISVLKYGILEYGAAAVLSCALNWTGGSDFHY